MKIASQTFLLRERCKNKKDLFDIIYKLSDYGYDGIEFFDCMDASPKEVSEVINRSGITAVNYHVYYSKWMDNAEKEIEFAYEAGIKNVTFPWLPPELRNEKGYGWLFDNLSGIAEKCEKVGLHLYYHNHDFEFVKINGEYLLDKILSVNSKIKLQLDTFWIMYAGIDPAEYIEKYKERMGLLHIKDYTDLEPEIRFCPIGSGKTDTGRLIKLAENIGMEWLVIDLDSSPIDTFKTLEKSIGYLKTII